MHARLNFTLNMCIIFNFLLTKEEICCAYNNFGFAPLSSSKIKATSVAFFIIRRSSTAWTYGLILQSPRLYTIPLSSAIFRSLSQPVHVISSMILIPLYRTAHTIGKDKKKKAISFSPQILRAYPHSIVTHNGIWSTVLACTENVEKGVRCK